MKPLHDSSCARSSPSALFAQCPEYLLAIDRFHSAAREAEAWSAQAVGAVRGAGLQPCVRCRFLNHAGPVFGQLVGGRAKHDGFMQERGAVTIDKIRFRKCCAVGESAGSSKRLPLPAPRVHSAPSPTRSVIRTPSASSSKRRPEMRVEASCSRVRLFSCGSHVGVHVHEPSFLHWPALMPWACCLGGRSPSLPKNRRQ
jgi:hypothetical protein